jgi:hypothetical protein
MKILGQTLVLILIIGFLPAPVVNAAVKSPKLSVECGQIVGLADEDGTYGLFSPEVSVFYYGSPLTVTSYFYRTPRTKQTDGPRYITKFTKKAPSTRYFVSNVDIQHKVLEFNQPQTGYLRFVIEAVDAKKRKSRFTCLYEDYYFRTPIVTTPKVGSRSSGSGVASRGFDSRNCTFNGKKLYGSVYFTSSSAFADFNVYFTSSSAFADLSVYFTSSSTFASSCGTWYRTSSSVFADFTVYITSSSAFADFTIYPTSSSAFAGT